MRHSLLLALLLVAACATAPGAQRFSGHEWRAVDVNGVPVVGERPLTLRIEADERVSGNAGCNTYSGSYQMMSKEGIRVSGVSSTRMACAPDIMEQERRFLSILENVEGYSFYSDGGMSLIAPDGRAIRFRR